MQHTFLTKFGGVEMYTAKSDPPRFTPQSHPGSNVLPAHPHPHHHLTAFTPQSCELGGLEGESSDTRPQLILVFACSAFCLRRRDRVLTNPLGL
jgi:hypothetical protein